MTDRNRRVRRQVSDVTDHSMDSSSGDSEEDFDPRRLDAARRAGVRQEQTRSKKAGTNGPLQRATTRVTSTTTDLSRQSIKLTMKVPPSKLREVMRVSEIDSLKDTLGGGTVLDGPRTGRRVVTPQTRRSAGRANERPKYTEQYSDEDGDGDEVDEEEDATMQDLGEDEEDDDDVRADEGSETQPTKRAPTHPKAPKITLKTASRTDGKATPKPKLIVTPARVGPVQSVEDQEIEDEEDDDEDEDEDEDDDAELESELDDNEDETNLNDEDIEEETNLLEEDEDAEGEEDLELQAGAGAEAELDDEDDEDDDSLGSGTATPDPSRMTARQRGRAIEPLMSLDMAPQQRKFFTDAEKAMKKDEHARKRKELTKRKVQEEKTAALNRLLKPQANKSRGAAPKAENLAAQLEAATGDEEESERANPLYTRWISTRDGVRLGVPEEWLGKRVGQCFGPPPPPSRGGLIQELD